MTYRFIVSCYGVLALGLVLMPAHVYAETDPSEQYTNQARMMVKEFAGQLKGELVQAMQAGGPTNAISVCNTAAPEIASALSAKYNTKIGRTSLKVRNVSNEADSWELTVLEQFEQRKQSGEELTKLEYAQQLEMNGKKVVRYMKAIPTQAVCLACHGTEISAQVQEHIVDLYPEDQATGFNEGDIRGAFTVIQKVN